MKKLAVFLFAILLFSVGTQAQQPVYTLTAKVPFTFIVRGDTLPPGNYMVQLSNMTVGPIMVRQSAGKKAEFIMQVPVTEQWTGHAQLTFHHVGDSYFLMEISDPRVGIQRVHQGDRYKKALQLASAQTVVIAAN